MISASSAWFGLVVGLALLLEVAVLLVLDLRRSPAEHRRHMSRLPMLFCLGVMLTGSDAARLRGWTGTGMAVVTTIGMLAAAAAVVLALVSLAARAFARSRAVPPR